MFHTFLDGWGTSGNGAVFKNGNGALCKNGVVGFNTGGAVRELHGDIETHGIA